MFEGFETPKQNWFKMPNEWTNISADISSLAELKVVEYVMRHTWGFQEYGLTKWISNDEFVNGRKRQDGSRMDKGTGLSLRSVQNGTKAAVSRGLLVEFVDDSDLGRVKKSYSVKMKPVAVGVQDLHPQVQDLPARGAKSSTRTEKETLERNSGEGIEENIETTESQFPSRNGHNDIPTQLKEEWGTTRREVELWPKVLSDLSTTMTMATYNANLQQSYLLQIKEPDRCAVVGVQSAAAQAWCENRLYETIKKALGRHLPEPLQDLTFISLSN